MPRASSTGALLLLLLLLLLLPPSMPPRHRSPPPSPVTCPCATRYMQAAHGQRVASDLGLPVGEGDGVCEGDGEAASSGAAPRVSVVGELGGAGAGAGAGAAPKKTLARKLSEAVMKRERANSLGHTYTCVFAALQPPAAARRGRRPLLPLRCCCGRSLARARTRANSSSHAPPTTPDPLRADTISCRSPWITRGRRASTQRTARRT